MTQIFPWSTLSSKYFPVTICYFIIQILASRLNDPNTSRGHFLIQIFRKYTFWSRYSNEAPNYINISHILCDPNIPLSHFIRPVLLKPLYDPTVSCEIFWSYETSHQFRIYNQICMELKTWSLMPYSCFWGFSFKSFFLLFFRLYPSSFFQLHYLNTLQYSSPFPILRIVKIIFVFFWRVY